MKPEEGPAAVETRDDDDFDPFRAADTRSGGGGVGWLALLLVLGLAGWNGWQWWQTHQAGSTVADAVNRQLLDLNARLDRDRQRLDELAAEVEDATGLSRRLGQLEAGNDAAGSRELELKRELDAVAGDVLGLQRSLEETRATMAALAVRDETPGRRVELSEIAFLLRAANERLVLFGDRAGAERALALADAQLVALDDPLYLSVRQAIAAARADLDNAPVIDAVLLTQQLDQLQSRIGALALDGEAAPASAEPVESPDAETGLWARFKATLAGLVTVRHRTDDESLFTLEDRDTLRQGLWLQLESARLALLRSDAAAWNASLARARTALTKWFDADDPGVRQSLSDLAQLETVDLAVTQPDISTPWSLFNRLRAAPAAVVPASPARVPGPADGESAGSPEPGEGEAVETPGGDSQ